MYEWRTAWKKVKLRKFSADSCANKGLINFYNLENDIVPTLISHDVFSFKIYFFYFAVKNHIIMKSFDSGKWKEKSLLILRIMVVFPINIPFFQNHITSLVQTENVEFSFSSSPSLMA